MIPRRTQCRTMALFGGASKSVPDSIYDIKIKTIDGKDESMSRFKGKVCVVVGDLPWLIPSIQSLTGYKHVDDPHVYFALFSCRFSLLLTLLLSVVLLHNTMTWLNFTASMEIKVLRSLHNRVTCLEDKNQEAINPLNHLPRERVLHFQC